MAETCMFNSPTKSNKSLSCLMEPWEILFLEKKRMKWARCIVN
jgi:hypothetical protein